VVASNQQIVRIDRESRTALPRELEEGVCEWIAAHAGQFSVILMSDYNKGVLTQRVIEATIVAAVKAGVPVLVDPKGADFARYHAVDPKAITRQQLDNAQAVLRSAHARFDANGHAVAAARAQLEAQKAQVEAASAAITISDVEIANAELQLSYVSITAPQDGQVTKRTVELGNYVVPGQALLAIVSPNLWVTANFKETQLAHMHAGQKVILTVDACPDLDLHAKVDSFQAGSGNAFSSLPAENATGNYVKVVQRVPVKLVFDDDRVSQCRMAPGMSVLPSVTVR